MIDFTEVEEVAEGCVIDCSVSYGDMELRIPRKFKAEFSSNSFFSDLEVKGHPDQQSQGTIFFHCNVSFGDLTVVYI